MQAKERRRGRGRCNRKEGRTENEREGRRGMGG